VDDGTYRYANDFAQKKDSEGAHELSLKVSVLNSVDVRAFVEVLTTINVCWLSALSV